MELKLGQHIQVFATVAETTASAALVKFENGVGLWVPMSALSDPDAEYKRLVLEHLHLNNALTHGDIYFGCKTAKDTAVYLSRLDSDAASNRKPNGAQGEGDGDPQT